MSHKYFVMTVEGTSMPEEIDLQGGTQGYKSAVNNKDKLVVPKFMLEGKTVASSATAISAAVCPPRAA